MFFYSFFCCSVMGISVTVLIPLFSFPFPGALHVWPGTCSCLLRPISAVTASAESFDNRLPRHPLHVRRGPALSVPFLLLSAETDFPGKPPYPQAVCLPRRPFSDPGTCLRLPGRIQGDCCIIPFMRFFFKYSAILETFWHTGSASSAARKKVFHPRLTDISTSDIMSARYIDRRYIVQRWR